MSNIIPPKVRLTPVGPQFTPINGPHHLTKLKRLAYKAVIWAALRAQLTGTHHSGPEPEWPPHRNPAAASATDEGTTHCSHDHNPPPLNGRLSGDRH